jgi:hypothetical protein
MDNFKIYINGRYSTKENLKLKARNLIEKRLVAIDQFLARY